jgi:hypothetical protein
MSRFQPAVVAIVVTATALAAIAMGFGIWATFTMNPVLLQREAALAGIYSLVLAALTAALAVIAWALRRGRETPPALQASGHVRPGPPLSLVGPAIEQGPVVAGDMPQEAQQASEPFNEHRDRRIRCATHSQSLSLVTNQKRLSSSGTWATDDSRDLGDIAGGGVLPAVASLRVSERAEFPGAVADGVDADDLAIPG